MPKDVKVCREYWRAYVQKCFIFSVNVLENLALGHKNNGVVIASSAF